MEIQHRTLAAMVKSMLLGAGLDSSFWSDALLHAVCMNNRLAYSSLAGNSTPCEAWTGQLPDLSNLCVFGSIAQAKKPGIK